MAVDSLKITLSAWARSKRFRKIRSAYRPWQSRDTLPGSLHLRKEVFRSVKLFPPEAKKRRSRKTGIFFFGVRPAAHVSRG